jgi:Tfp pilus assembly PilM family ATPase
MAFGFKKIVEVLNEAFPTPEYLTFNPSGVDIASDAIYFMKFKKTRDGVVPDVFEKIPFGKNIDINENLLPEDKKVVVEALIKLKNKYKLEYIISSLPEQKTYIFNTVLPKEAQSDIPSFIRYQIEENVPMAASDVNFYYYLTGEVNKSGDLGLSVSVFPKQVTSLYTDIFSTAGLFPISFFAESRALLHALIKEGDKTPYLLVRLLPNRVSVSILDDEVIQYTSDLQVNTENIFNSLQSPEATSLKEFLNKVLIYWFTSKKDLREHKKIENVLLVGYKAGDPEVIDFLARSLKINVEIGQVWTNCFDIKNHVPEIDQKTALDYAVAIGLAIRCINYA